MNAVEYCKYDIHGNVNVHCQNWVMF